jgi:hypothetical protein
MGVLRDSEKEKMREMAEKYNLTLDEVKEIVYSPYEMMRDVITKIEFKDELTEEEFKKLRTNFSMPHLFKLHASVYAFKEIVRKKNKK